MPSGQAELSKLHTNGSAAAAASAAGANGAGAGVGAGGQVDGYGSAVPRPSTSNPFLSGAIIDNHATLPAPAAAPPPSPAQQAPAEKKSYVFNAIYLFVRIRVLLMYEISCIVYSCISCYYSRVCIFVYQ